MNHKRTIFPLRACLAIACICFPATGLSDDGFQDDDLYYRFEDGSCTRVCVSGLKKKSATHIVIPSTVVYEWEDWDDPDEDGNPRRKRRTCDVTSIGNVVVSFGDSGYSDDGAFSGCSSLVSVTIPDSVTRIGREAFYNCGNLTSVTIGNSVTSIGNIAFAGCTSLSSVTIPNSVTSIGASAFADCISLASVTIPNSVTSIANYAFHDCTSLSSVTIPNSVSNIDDGVFRGCSGIVSVTIPNSVTSIGRGSSGYGDGAFSRCSSLASVTIPDSVTSIGYKTFEDCTSLESVTIPDSVTSIGDYAFYNCIGLASVTIPDGVTSIGQSAFDSCASLATVQIGSGLTAIGVLPFRGCSGLTSFSVASGNQTYQSVNHLLLTNNGKTLIHGVNGDVTIPDGVTNVCEYAFHNCRDLTSVIIPDTVQSLATTAFDGCDRLWTSWYRTLANQAASGGSGGGGAGGSSGTRVSMTVTNVVLHYVTQSVPSGAVVPPFSSGFVNVVAEVGAGSAVAISSDWADQYPGFVAKFGNDFREAVTKPTGKHDGSGNPMFVWQDFVAGTDPTDESDVFTASITFNATTGEPVVSWSPELSATEAAKRVYRIFGKIRLTDPDWTLVDGDAGDYNFFKVAVEMK